MSYKVDQVDPTDREKLQLEPLRVVHLVPNLRIGGMERLVLDMLRLSDPVRISTRVLCIGERGEFAEEAEGFGVKVHALNVSPGRNPRLPFQIAGYFRSSKAEVVHTHGPYAHFYGAMAARIAGKCRVVHTMHGFPWPQTRRRRMLNQFSAFLTEYVVAVSEDLAEYARHDIGVRTKKLRVIYNGIDSSRFTNGNEKRHDATIAIMVARLSSEKDFSTLLRAADAVRRQCPDFQLMLAGDGPLRNEIESQVAELELTDHVQLLGKRSDIPQLLSNARVFVLSTHTEGLSIALLEAMASGLAVVATDVGGNREVIVQDETGFLIPPRSPDELAARLLWLLQRPDQLQQMGVAGKRRVEALFDVRRMVSMYESLYWESAYRVHENVFMTAS